jgi:predicted DNA-binding WGR domain protein
MKERIFHLIGDKSAKFWAISLKGKSHTVRFGRIGTQGQMKMKTFSSSEEARESQDRLIKEKVQEGYKEGAFPRRGGPEELNTPEALPVSGHNIGNTHSKLRPGLKRKPKNYPCYGIFLVSRPD